MPISRTGFSATPSKLDFGNVRLSTSTSPLTVTITNVSTSGPVSFFITPNDSRFVATPNGNQTLANPGDTLVVSFVFNATAVLGMATCNYINFIGIPPTTTISAIANVVSSTTPAWNALPGTINFGSLKIGTISSNRNVTVTNTGSVNVVINTITLVPTDFTLSGLPALPVTVVPGGTFTFQVKANSSFRGINDYSPGIVLTPSVGPPVTVELIYTGFTITPAFTLTGATQGVLFGLSGTWDTIFRSTIARSLVSKPCEMPATLAKQFDFNNAGSNTYLNKVFVRTEPSGNLGITITDTSMVSGQTATKSVFTLADQASDSNGLVKWSQFDMEMNGESHLITLTVAVSGGILIMDLWIFSYEPRGPVYEGS